VQVLEHSEEDPAHEVKAEAALKLGDKLLTALVVGFGHSLEAILDYVEERVHMGSTSEVVPGPHMPPVAPNQVVFVNLAVVQSLLAPVLVLVLEVARLLTGLISRRLLIVVVHLSPPDEIAVDLVQELGRDLEPEIDLLLVGDPVLEGDVDHADGHGQLKELHANRVVPELGIVDHIILDVVANFWELGNIKSQRLLLWFDNEILFDFLPPLEHKEEGLLLTIHTIKIRSQGLLSNLERVFTLLFFWVFQPIFLSDRVNFGSISEGSRLRRVRTDKVQFDTLVALFLASAHR